MNVLLIILGLVLLVVGGEFLVRASVGLSFKLKLSKLVIGMTVVSFATSAPELLVSLQAALDGVSDIALGNVIGSNIANIGLVLGITAIISPLIVDREFYKLNWPMLMFMSFALYFFLSNDNLLSAVEGAILFTVLVMFLILLIRDSRKKTKASIIAEDIDESLAVVSNFKIGIWLIIGAAGLYYGSEWLVDGAKGLAQAVGISDYAISVTVIAIGTSVPELAASVIAALKKEKAISLGNLIGSNIFNIASVLGLTAMIKPIAVESPKILSTNIFWMIGFAAVLIPLVFLGKRFSIGRKKGLLLFVAYLIFIGLAFS
ncbi:hypothetical protein BTO05_05295 [Winogradskyella sp. PC-19]|uniref:calcium/sodium antiporter n=1 Tax=unclassified Winogradskyella TaxID=2615021 RepID=UPI000B3D475F|nr:MULTISPECIES: calcium/sodium antiporter [unclassified Winogradskyella]ARV09078.1 hypothetical protein BTO05_05295 [Winogradskyella sp. PC-19]RZN81410.1 MAG: calcium/sodium antiporter [Winogradskyella sp.]